MTARECNNRRRASTTLGERMSERAAGGGSTSGYLLGGRVSELERLQLQAGVWEPAGSALLGELGDGSGLRVLDVGCGALGWLRVLAAWVGSTSRRPDGCSARKAVECVSLRRDDLFASSA